MSDRYVALFRGINVGGKNKLPMKPLAAIFAAAGCRAVTPYIQSGNVVFEADPEVVAGLAAGVRERVAAGAGFDAPVLIRSAGEVAGVVAANPMLDVESPEQTLHVLFFDDRPGPARVATLDPDRSPPDRFAVVDRVAYLHLPNGAARTRLTVAYFDSRLATTATGRNWRTVLKLRAMLGDA